MRILFSVIFLVQIIALAVCGFYARKSHKEIAPSVRKLLRYLIPPVIGNLIIVASGNKLISTVGCYIYFIGMDFVILALLLFTFSYCRLSWPSRKLRYFVLAVLTIDVGQLLLNPFFHHAFRTEAILVDGYNYYRLIPYAGQTFHRVVVYAIYLSAVIIFIFKTFRSSRINSERYSVILFVMLFTGIIQTFYIFSRAPIDVSMIGYGLFGILVFYFSLYYRPLRLMDRMLAGIAAEMNEALFLFDSNNRCIWANKPGIEMAGLKSNDFDEAEEKLSNLFSQYADKKDDWTTTQISGSGKDAKHYVLEKHAVKDDRDRFIGSFLSVRDITEQQNALEEEKYIARHDSLTDLYTREYLYDRMKNTLEKNPATLYYVIFADIREFKIINDIFGNEFGDFVLLNIADWIRNTFTQSDAVFGRLAGDTFGILLPKEKFDPEVVENSLSSFVVRKGNASHSVLVHLGVYEVNEPDIKISVMFDRAHMALSSIRDQYKTHIAYYDDNMREKVLWNQHISSQLHNAIKERQLQPYLQPIVDQNGTIVGAEALVRWIHPTDGFLSPAMFVPVFENNGMISEVDQYMWQCACEILARWEKEGIDRFISINISPKDFYFMDVAEVIKNLAKQYSISPGKLRIEITETVMMADINTRMSLLHDLKQNGFYVEIDDFGSGYSSLNMLKDMPVDLLKIDMAFLSKSNNEQKAEKIIHNIINMSYDLGISPLSEGVETEAQYHMLSQMGCQLFQGYYFAKPMSVTDFETYCRQNSGCTA